MSLAGKEADLRWHVATTGHREFTCVPDYVPRRDDPFEVNPPTNVFEQSVVNQHWIITCCGARVDLLDPVTCAYERRISDAELREADRMHLREHVEIIAWIADIAREPERVAPSAWDKILGVDEDP